MIGHRDQTFFETPNLRTDFSGVVRLAVMCGWRDEFGNLHAETEWERIGNIAEAPYSCRLMLPANMHDEFDQHIDAWDSQGAPEDWRGEVLDNYHRALGRVFQ